MHHQSVVLGLAILVCLSVLAPPAVGQAGTDSTGEWRTLAPAGGEIDRANHTRIGPDLSAVLERDAIRHAADLQRRAVDQAASSAESDSSSYDRYARELQSISAQIDRLSARQRRLAARYGDQEIDGTDLLTTLATVQIRAKALADRLVAIRAAGRRLESRGLVRRANTNIERLGHLEGTVRSEVAATQRLETSPNRFYVETANRSMALATATRQDYLREVTLSPRRQSTGTAIRLSQAVSIVATAYPELYADRQTIEVGGSRSAGFYRVGIAGTGEFLTASVDADSRSVFREDRRVSLARLTLVSAAETTTGAYRLIVEQTYRGGPARVTVERTNGDPADARVRLAGTPIGRTGEDGQRWTTLPARTSVGAEIDGTTLSVQLETRAPPALNTTAG